MSANVTLPPLNPLQARSTVAMLLIFVGALAPFLPEAWRQPATDLDHNLILGWVDQAVTALNQIIAAYNELLVMAGAVWGWFERRAPNRRLSFFAPLEGRAASPWVPLLVGFGILSYIGWAGAAQAQAAPVRCASHEEMAQHLMDGWGESPVSVALTTSGGLVEVYANPETGTWTLVFTSPAMRACVQMAGNNFEMVEPVPPGEAS